MDLGLVPWQVWEEGNHRAEEGVVPEREMGDVGEAAVSNRLTSALILKGTTLTLDIIVPFDITQFS